MALGNELDGVLAIFRDFLHQNPGEIVNLYFGNYGGDAGVITNYIADRLLAYFNGRMLVRDKMDAPWPTLGEMLKQNIRVIVWFSGHRHALKTKYNWVLSQDDLVYGTWGYSNSAFTSAALKKFVMDHCANPKEPNKWQTMDISYSPSADSVIKQLKTFKKVEVCFDKMVDYVNEWIEPVSQYCSKQLKFIHRVHVDQYWRGKVIQITKFLNEENLKKVASKLI